MFISFSFNIYHNEEKKNWGYMKINIKYLHMITASFHEILTQIYLTCLSLSRRLFWMVLAADLAPSSSLDPPWFKAPVPA